MQACNAYLPIVTENDDTDVVSLEVEGHSPDAGLEFNHLTCLDLGETEDSGDTITDGNDGSEFFQVVLHNLEVRDTDRHKWSPPYLAPRLWTTVQSRRACFK